VLLGMLCHALRGAVPCGLFERVAVLGCSMVSLKGVTRVPALYDDVLCWCRSKRNG